MQEKYIIKGGLTDLPISDRDFSHVDVFGSVRAQDLPTGDFRVAPPEDIDDQQSEDFCTMSSSSSANELQEMVPLEYYFNAFVAKVIVQKNPDSWGCDLRTACMTHVNFGALALEYSPFRHWTERPTRDQVLDMATWDSKSCSLDEYKMLAAEHRKGSLFEVEKGPHDRFDNWRSALWIQRSGFRAIITGAKWRPSWTDAPGGIIPATGWEDESTTGHAFIIVGQQYIDNEPHLVAQLSNGIDIGDKGFFFFKRSTINTEFTFGAFMFNDMPRETAETHLYYGTTVNTSFCAKFIKIISRIFADKLHI